jgi:hypothetical protein
MSWRLIFLIIVLYFLYRSIKNVLFRGSGRVSGNGPERPGQDPFYEKITDQQIEDIDFEEVEPEDRE